MGIVSCCARTELCPRCYTQAVDNLRGVALSRGMAWADRVGREPAAFIYRARPWPAYAGRCEVLARRIVRGLVEDPRLEAELAAACAREASRWWSVRWML